METEFFDNFFDIAHARGVTEGYERAKRDMDNGVLLPALTLKRVSLKQFMRRLDEIILEQITE